MHLLWIVFILLSGQIQINTIRFPIVIPGSWLKFPWLLFLLSERLHVVIMRVFMTPTSLLCHLCLLRYVTVDIQMRSFLLGRRCLPLSVSRKRKREERKGWMGSLLWAKAARQSKGGFVRAPRWLSQEKNNVIPPLTNAVWIYAR